jgi:hypothetical protein
VRVVGFFSNRPPSLARDIHTPSVWPFNCTRLSRTVGEIVQKGQTRNVPGPRTLPSGETNDSWTRV